MSDGRKTDGTPQVVSWLRPGVPTLPQIAVGPGALIPVTLPVHQWHLLLIEVLPHAPYGLTKPLVDLITAQTAQAEVDNASVILRQISEARAEAERERVRADKGRARPARAA
jgi:hypothetical protein